jgi:Ca-activated chloride channel family protein
MTAMDFMEPTRLWFLLGVGVILAAYVVGQFQRRRYAMRFSSSHLLDKVAPKRAGWGRHLLAAVFLLGLSTAVVASAQPQGDVKVPKQRATIMLALDTSLSMKATDVTPSRIAAAKAGAVRFVNSIPKKLNVGLVSFDGSATVDVTPTTDRNSVTQSIKSLSLHEGTAIGDAVSASLDAIKAVPKGADGKKVPAVIVLMSDGATTVGKPTADAIPEAKKAGVAVYTIAYGTPNGVVDVTLPDTGEQTRIPVPVDAQALAELASGTGGKTFTAQSASDLKSVYQELGSSIGYDTTHTDISWKFALAAAAMIGLAGLVSALWFQRLP